LHESHADEWRSLTPLDMGTGTLPLSRQALRKEIESQKE